MRPPGYCLLLAWTLSVWSGPVAVGGTTRRDVVNAARCRVRCLGETVQTTLELPINTKGRPVSSFANCLEDEDCTLCLKPCSQPFVSLALCQRVCETETESCERSCHFLKQISIFQSGTCPPEEDLLEFEGACLEECQSDQDCSLGAKCCSTGCGRSCQDPDNVYSGMPNVPKAPTIRERPKGGSLELKWDSVSSNTTGPILYIVDAKYNVGKHHSESHMTPWQQSAQTTTNSAIIRDVTPGHWYQFRIASVNIYGSRGASPPTEPFKLSREPRPPSPPSNLTEGDTLILGGRVAVSIYWLPPKKSDLPITRYKVFWSKRLKTVPTEPDSELDEHRQVLPGGQLEFQIPDLVPDTTYIVKIQAICQYGDTKLKSEKASVYITTYPLPRAAERVVPTPSVVLRPLPTPSAIFVLEVEPPFYQNGLLKANVSWSLPVASDSPDIAKVVVSWTATACIATDTVDDGLATHMSGISNELFFVIYDLRFACHYNVKVRPMSVDAVLGPETHIKFKTPTCTEVSVSGETAPNCPTNVPRGPDKPANLQHTFLISNHNITTRLSWDPPLSDSPITGYRVVWGPSLIDGENPILDTTTAQTKVLDAFGVHSFSIGNLPEVTTYVVKIQAMSRVGDSRISTIFFTTPMLQKPATPIDPPYIAITPAVKIDRNKGKEEEQSTRSPTPQPIGRPSHISHSNASKSQLNFDIIFITSLLVCLNSAYL